jgi:hypothetical protein
MPVADHAQEVSTMDHQDGAHAKGYPIGRGYGHDYMRGGEVGSGYGYAVRAEYERSRGELRERPVTDDAKGEGPPV